MVRFANRKAAGQELAESLLAYKNASDAIVLALPRGGVVVAAEIAQRLNIPLDLLLVRKIGLPSDPELAIGALALPNVMYLNDAIIKSRHLSQIDIETAVEREVAELRRRNSLYRAGMPPPNLAGKTAIIVDDGIATGADMMAAVNSLQSQRPDKIVIAAPVAARESLEIFRGRVEEIVCL